MRQHLQRDIGAPDLTAAGLRFAGGRIFVVNARQSRSSCTLAIAGVRLAFASHGWMATPHRLPSSSAARSGWLPGSPTASPISWSARSIIRLRKTSPGALPLRSGADAPASAVNRR